MEVKMVCVLLAGVCTNRYCTGFACLGGEERRSLHMCRQACVIHMSNGISMATVSMMC